MGRDLYIIQMATTGDVKIGRSGDVTRRLRQLQTGSPHELRLLLQLTGNGFYERRLHRQLYDYRLRKNGEWFRETCLPDLPDWIYEQLDLDGLDWWRGDPKAHPRPLCST